MPGADHPGRWPASRARGRLLVWQCLVFVVVVLAVLVAVLAVAALVRGVVLAGGGATGASPVGVALALISLLLGDVFLLYSLKYYVSGVSALLAMALLSARNGNGNGNANGNGSGRRVYLDTEPFVSIHIATYNERRVLQRLLEACTALQYDNYEVILVDDSTDESRGILDAWEGRPGLKIIRRDSRSGYKGGALAEALRRTDPRTVYVVVYDADSVPFPDSIQRFLPYFYDLDRSALPEVAAVQSYQWHVLNKSESWLTEAVRAEYAGSYMVERTFQETAGAMKMIAGTGYMIRADVLRRVGWGPSITEDWQLTLSLYTAGYKVVYTPYAETPAECVATFSRLSRQRMRWAEGHTHNVRRAFWPVMRSDRVSPMEKLEFLYYAVYYLQATLLVAGTLSWLVAEVLLHTHVPDWTAVLGWSLLLTNLFALPFMNAVGLVLEDAPAKDLLGVLGAVAVSFLLVPFQTWAAVKGLFERDEGPWFRTPKTGRITDSVRHLRRVRRWLRRPRGRSGRPSGPSRANGTPRRPARRAGWVVTGSLLLALAALTAGAVRAPEVEAASIIYLRSTAISGGTFSLDTSPGSINPGGGGAVVTIGAVGQNPGSSVWPGPATLAAQTISSSNTFSLTEWVSSTSTGAPLNAIITFGFSSSATCTGTITTIATITTPFANTGTTMNGFTTPNFSPAANVLVPAGSRFCLTLAAATPGQTFTLQFSAPTGNPQGGSTHLNSSQTIFLPDRALLLAWLAPLVPGLVRGLRRRRRRC